MPQTLPRRAVSGLASPFRLRMKHTEAARYAVVRRTGSIVSAQSFVDGEAGGTRLAV
jgi:hypothetical protein